MTYLTSEMLARLLEWTGQIPAPKHTQAVKVARALPPVLEAPK